MSSSQRRGSSYHCSLWILKQVQDDISVSLWILKQVQDDISVSLWILKQVQDNIEKVCHPRKDEDHLIIILYGS